MFNLTREEALNSVGKGWSELINNLYDAKPDDVEVWDVKEKFGTLRFYIGIAPDWYQDLVHYYEKKSATICEECGDTGKLRTDLSWMQTLCDKHYDYHKNLRWNKELL